MTLDEVRAKLAKISMNRNKIPTAQAYRKILEFNGDHVLISKEIDDEKQIALQTKADEMRIAAYEEFLGE